MQKLYPYLTFNGNCREAMTFYQECLGGTLDFQTVGEMPESTHMPVRMKNCILHASLRKENLVLLGTDMTEDDGLTKGNSISIFMECNRESEIRQYYEKLSDSGEAIHPIEQTVWGALFGGLRDKYGNHWLLHCKTIM